MHMTGSAFLVPRNGGWIAEPATHLRELTPEMSGQRWWADVDERIVESVAPEQRRVPCDVVIDVPASVSTGGFVENGAIGPVTDVIGPTRLPPAANNGSASGPPSTDAEARLAQLPITWPVLELVGLRGGGEVWTLVPVPEDEIIRWRAGVDAERLTVAPWLTPL